ncbi:M23 family metallopeptidase [Microbacterium sp. Marseille-Q6965]|uniref:M23 family metallopeptidase n=1 Tax=Microbacterium sp. Marseille-Q6965 TaxID=2965072 RepID=UPI0021B802F5|nr:M23 family metallopeptidase [Microbacterium sp. Marseille-Q6965]
MSAGSPEATDPTRTGAPAPAKISRRDIRIAERALRAESAPKIRPLRAAGTMTAVLALIAGVAIPAYAATQGGGEATAEQVTAHDIAEADAQSLTVGGGATASQLSASSYSGTTASEIEKEKAAAAAAKRAKEMAAEAAAAAASSSAASVYSGNATPSAPSEGVVFPLPAGAWTSGRGLGDSGYHKGWDLLASTGTPIFAAADGVVSQSGWFGGYGNAVTIESNVGGSATTTRYAHMSSIAAAAGQTVTAGQVIGYVGSTGSSTAPHLHFEVYVNGGLVSPQAWLPY